MKLLILDTRNGDDVTDLYVAEPGRRSVDRMRLNYVPELDYDRSRQQLLVVETDLNAGHPDRGAHYWLRILDGRDFALVYEVETAARPMYAGFPNRSARVSASPSGRYVYFQELQRHPRRTDVYRTRACRLDRDTNTLEQGQLPIDSCIVDFGPIGDGEDELYFHLCCDAPNTVVFGGFSSPECDAVTMGELSARRYSLDETCGSWLSQPDRALYCTTRNGLIYRVTRTPPRAELFCRLPIAPPRTVPLHHIRGTGDHLLVGVARDDVERSLSLVSEIWVVSIEDAAVARIVTLTSPIINFVVDEAAGHIFGVNPYDRSVQLVELATGRLLGLMPEIGVTPCEVQLIP